MPWGPLGTCARRCPTCRWLTSKSLGVSRFGVYGSCPSAQLYLLTSALQLTLPLQLTGAASIPGPRSPLLSRPGAPRQPVNSKLTAVLPRPHPRPACSRTAHARNTHRVARAQKITGMKGNRNAAAGNRGGEQDAHQLSHHSRPGGEPSSASPRTEATGGRQAESRAPARSAHAARAQAQPLAGSAAALGWRALAPGGQLYERAAATAPAAKLESAGKGGARADARPQPHDCSAAKT